jgi:hypothetical protein
MNKQQYILGLKDGYNLKKEQVLNRVYSAINDMAIEKLKQTKAGCLVIRTTEEEAEKIALSNPDLFVELEIIHEKY